MLREYRTLGSVLVLKTLTCEKSHFFLFIKAGLCLHPKFWNLMLTPNCLRDILSLELGGGVGGIYSLKECVKILDLGLLSLDNPNHRAVLFY